MRGRNQDEAASGVMPRRANTKPNLASVDAIRMSIASCMVTPIPTAAPFTHYWRIVAVLENGATEVFWGHEASLTEARGKREFAARSVSTAPRGLPVELPEHAPELKLLVRGAELATDEEKSRNPRSTPVRLRAAERTRKAAA